MRGELRTGLVILASLFISCQITPVVANSGTLSSNSETLSSLLRAASVEVQKWGEGAEDERDVTVYSFKPEIKLEELIQAVKGAGFFQTWSGEYTRDWELTSGVLRWCVPSGTERWDREIQFSAAGETKVYTYGFKPIPPGGLLTWTAVTDSKFGENPNSESEFVPHGVTGIAYGGGTFVAVGYRTTAVSVDGVTWTVADPYKFNFADILGVAYGNGKFVVFGNVKEDNYLIGRMAYSADGVTWTTAADKNTFNYRSYGRGEIHAVTFGSGRFVAGGFLGKMAYSADGVTWTAVADSTFGHSPSDSINGIAYDGGKFVAVGAGGKMAYSADGIIWTAILDSTFDGSEINSIAYGGGKFVAGAKDGKMAYSADGVTWTAIPDSTFDGGVIVSIAYGGGKFVAGGHGGKMAQSADGIGWTAIPSTFDGGEINSIAYGGSKFVAGGEDGKIAYSNSQE